MAGDAQVVGINLAALIGQINDAKENELITREDLMNALLQANAQIEEQKRINAAIKKEQRRADLEQKVKRKQLGVKSDGVPIAKGADPIRSYADFKAIETYFLSKGTKAGRRNAAIFAVGCATGLRGSDVLRLKMEDVFASDGSYRDRIYLVEKKTGKYQECLITEAVRHYLDMYLSDADKRKNGYVFPSQMGAYDVKNSVYVNTGASDALTPKALSTAMKAVGDDLGLPIHISAHTMRHSFACIAYRLGGSMQSNSVQIAMNHSNTKITDGYTKHIRREENDRIRKIVSDFLMGKTNQNLILWEKIA